MYGGNLVTRSLVGTRVVGGTWTVSGTWTIPAVTLGGTVTLGGQVFDAGAGSAQINTTGSQDGLKIQASASTHGPRIELFHSHTTPEINFQTGSLKFSGYDGAGTPALMSWGFFNCLYTNVGDGTEASKFSWTLQDGGGSNEAATLTGAGELWLDTFVNPDDGVKVSSTQVVSAQGAAVANPTDAASTQARLIDLLGRLRTHGLIAT